LTPYWVLLFFFSAGALLTPGWSNRGAAPNPLFVLGAIAVALMIGLRFHVGGDWTSYERIFFAVSHSNVWDAVTNGDPGFRLLNWVAKQVGGDLWLVDLVCGAVFVTGVYKLARLQPNPWLAVVVAVPYLIIVVGMGYTRQSIALGFGMIALAGLMRGSTAPRFVIYIVLATLFHKSAIVMMLALAAGHRSRVVNVLIGASAAFVLYDLFVSSAFPTLSRNYLEAGYDAQGATVRVFMNFVPAVLFLLRLSRFGFDEREINVVRIMAYAGLVFPILLWVVPSSAAVDRLALYISPLQMIILSRIPGVYVKEDFGKVIIIAYAVAVQFVWLNFAQHAGDWIPYRVWPTI
jgi:hypothetical protein